MAGLAGFAEVFNMAPFGRHPGPLFSVICGDGVSISLIQIPELGWQVDGLMDHHEPKASKEASGHGEVCMLTVGFKGLIGLVEVRGAVPTNLVRGLNKVVFEDAITACRCFPLMSFFIGSSTLLASGYDSSISAELLAGVENKAWSEFGIDTGGKSDSDAS